MSHVPSSAMPHAGTKPKKDGKGATGPSLKERAGKIADKAKENPKTTIAAGAAVLAGAVAAAAIPLVKAARSKSDGKGSAKKSSAKKAAAKKA